MGIGVSRWPWVVRSSSSMPNGATASSSRTTAGAMYSCTSLPLSEPASTQDAADPLQRQNPLGKVPVLQLDDGIWLYDSPVILEYLDSVAGGGRIIPKDTKARFEALRLEALGDGILDASVLQVYEG